MTCDIHVKPRAVLIKFKVSEDAVGSILRDLAGRVDAFSFDADEGVSHKKNKPRSKQTPKRKPRRRRGQEPKDMAPTIRLYPTYLFTSKDPAIDKLRVVIKNQRASYDQIQAASKVKVRTMRGWFHGKTRRPQRAKLAAVAKALGMEWDGLVEEHTRVIPPAPQSDL